MANPITGEATITYSGGTLPLRMTARAFLWLESEHKVSQADAYTWMVSATVPGDKLLPLLHAATLHLRDAQPTDEQLQALCDDLLLGDLLTPCVEALAYGLNGQPGNADRLKAVFVLLTGETTDGTGTASNA